MDELQRQSMASKARRAEAKEKRESKVVSFSKEADKRSKSPVSKPFEVKAETYPKPVIEPPMTKAAEPVVPAMPSTPAATAQPEIKPAVVPVDTSVFNEGTRITHKKFGPGIITGIGAPDRHGEYMVDVKFDSGAAKRFMGPSVFEKRFLEKED